MAAVGKFVLWARRTSVSSVPRRRIVLETLFFARMYAQEGDRGRRRGDRARGGRAPARGQVISSLGGEWTPKDFANDYREDLKQMLEAKLAGREVVAPEPVAETP